MAARAFERGWERKQGAAVQSRGRRLTGKDLSGEKGSGDELQTRPCGARKGPLRCRGGKGLNPELQKTPSTRARLSIEAVWRRPFHLTPVFSNRNATRRRAWSTRKTQKPGVFLDSASSSDSKSQPASASSQRPAPAAIFWRRCLSHRRDSSVVAQRRRRQI